MRPGRNALVQIPVNNSSWNFLMKQFKTLQYEKIKTITKNSGLFLGNFIYNFCIIMDMCNKFIHLSSLSLEVSLEEAEKLIRKDCNNFLKTKQGFHYLMMKYPNLSVSEAVNEYIKTALWIDSIV